LLRARFVGPYFLFTPNMGVPRTAKGKGKLVVQQPTTAPLKKVFTPTLAGKGTTTGRGGFQQMGKGKTALPELKGYAGPRERVVAGRVTGKVLNWKGKFGWVMPDAPIDHPMAGQRGGRIYLDQIDVEKELSGPGAAVSFFVYQDESGLGAEHCIPSKGPVIQKTIEKAPLKSGAKGVGKLAKGGGKDKLKPTTKAMTKPNVSNLHQEETEKKSASEPPDQESRTPVQYGLSGVVRHWKGEVGWIKPDEPVALEEPKKGGRKNEFYAHVTDVEGEPPLSNAKVSFNLYSDKNGYGCENVVVIEQGDGLKPTKETKAAQDKPATKTSLALKLKLKQKKGKGQGKGKNAREDKGSEGPDLPREIVSDEPLEGEIVFFGRKMGWILPSVPVEHPEAEKRDGKIYCHVNDSISGERLEKGTRVQFTLYADSSGLGAQEVMAL